MIKGTQYKGRNVVDNFQLPADLAPIFQEIEQIIGKETYDLWFKPAGFSFQDNNLNIITPNDIWGKTIQNRYEHIVTDCFLKHTGRTITVSYKVDTTSPKQTAVLSAQDVEPMVEPSNQPAPANPFV